MEIQWTAGTDENPPYPRMRTQSRKDRQPVPEGLCFFHFIPADRENDIPYTNAVNRRK